MTIPTSHLAGRVERFAARIIDGLIIGAPMLLMMPKMFAMAAMDKQLRQAGLSEEEITAQIDLHIVTENFLYIFFIAAAACIILLIIQLAFLAKDGQTIGKKAFKIRIVKNDTGKNGGFVPNVLLRSWINSLLTMIPFYGIVDMLFIFREDKRCIHDLIAGTSVVKA